MSYPTTMMYSFQKLFFAVFVGAFLLSSTVSAQREAEDVEDTEVKIPKMEKKLRREWKARLREMTPEELKILVDRSEGVSTDLAKKDQEIAALKTQVTQAQEEAAKAKASSTVSLAATAPLPSAEEPSKQAYEARNQENAKGILFKVQIGSFRNKDLAKYLDNTKNFSGEEVNGVRSYTLGAFSDYWEADNFKKYLREMGVSDAWTVAYKDGKRVPLRDVLEGAAATSAGVGMN